MTSIGKTAKLCRDWKKQGFLLQTKGPIKEPKESK